MSDAVGISELGEIADVKNKIVKLIIDTEDYDPKFINKLNESNPLRLKVIDNREVLKEVQEEINTNVDTLAMSKEYIDKNVEEVIDKKELFDVYSEIYKEAKTL